MGGGGGNLCTIWYNKNCNHKAFGGLFIIDHARSLTKLVNMLLLISLYGVQYRHSSIVSDGQSLKNINISGALHIIERVA
jgi:hypothetical protein